MLTNKKGLIIFSKAFEDENVEFIGVGIMVKDDEGEFHKEIIMFCRREFAYKLKYYSNAYDDNLVLKSNNDIMITGVFASSGFVSGNELFSCSFE